MHACMQVCDRLREAGYDIEDVPRAVVEMLMADDGDGEAAATAALQEQAAQEVRLHNQDLSCHHTKGDQTDMSIFSVARGLDTHNLCHDVPLPASPSPCSQNLSIPIHP